MNKVRILGLLRHLLTYAGGYFVGKGYLDDQLSNELIGGLMTLIGGVWSLYAPEKKA